MIKRDHDRERRQFLTKSKHKRGSFFVNPKTLKMILTAGPWIAKIIRLLIELVKLFKG